MVAEETAVKRPTENQESIFVSNCRTTGKKWRTSQTSCQDRDDCPAKALEEVVGERNKVEAIAVRDGALAGARRAKGAHSQVSVQVRKLGELWIIESTRSWKHTTFAYCPESSEDPQGMLVISEGVHDRRWSGGESRSVDIRGKDDTYYRDLIKRSVFVGNGLTTQDPVVTRTNGSGLIRMRKEQW